MRNFLKTACVLTLVMVAGGAAYVFFSDKKVVVYNDGRVKTVDHIWESGDSIFYEINNEIYLLDQAEIKAYGKRPIIHYLLDVQSIAQKNVRQFERRINKFLSKTKMFDILLTAIFLAVMGFLLVLMTLAFIRRRPDRNHRHVMPLSLSLRMRKQHNRRYVYHTFPAAPLAQQLSIPIV